MKQPKYTLDEEMRGDDAVNGAAIQSLLEFYAVQQKDLAEALEISASYLSDMLNGKRHLPYPLFEKAKKILNSK